MAEVLFITMKNSPWEHYYDNIIPHLKISYKHAYNWNYSEILSHKPSVVVSVHNFGVSHLIPRLKEAGIATLLLQEGATEWMMHWNNPRLVKQIPPRHRPVMYDKIGVFGPLYRRIDESWGNLGKCEMVGSPRWDNLKVPEREPREGRKFRLMLASARVVGYDESTVNEVIRGFKDLSDYLETRSDIEVFWRVGEPVEKALALQNNNTQMERLLVGEALSRVDAVVSTPSSFLIEAMITKCPVASLDYIVCPRYFNPAWVIHCADDIGPVISELVNPPASKMMFQEFICDDVIYKPGSAGKRAAKLIHELSEWAKNGRKPEALPAAILEDTTWPVYLPPRGLSLSTLFPDHPMFTEQSEYEMRAELLALRQQVDKYSADLDRYMKKVAELQQRSYKNRIRQIIRKSIPERIRKILGYQLE